MEANAGRTEIVVGQTRRWGSGLPQSEIAGDEEHYHNNAHNVENTAHVSFSFLSRDRIYVEPDVLPSDEAQGDLKLGDIIRIGVLYLVYACEPLL